MINAFLSHSSQQKGYVEMVAKKLGKFSVIYDAWTFEIGNKTIDEIFSGIDASGIFVYFISNEAMESPWVEKEINKAEEYLKNGKLKRFLPLLIDNTVKHTDSRIPYWIKEEYNIKYISKPTKCCDLIRQSQRLVSWDLFPKHQEIEQIFIGRTTQIRHYEERIYDFNKITPSTIIVNGLPSIGRRKFIKHVLIKSNKMKQYYSPPIVTLDNRNSIEDFIIMLYGLGYSDKNINFISNLSKKTISEKVDIVVALLTELHYNNDILFLVDNNSIINKNGIISDWFLQISSIMSKLNALIICIIGRSRINFKQLIYNDTIFSIEIPELEIYERNALFKSYLEIENISLSHSDIQLITNQLKGYPEQVIYTISLIKHEGKDYVIKNPHEIIDYSREKVAKIIKNIEGDDFALQVLKIFSESEFLSLNLLENIMKDDFKLAEKYITQFSNEFIIEFIGNAKEFLRLNDSIKDHVQRLGFKLSDKYQKNLQQHTKESFKDYEILDRDISDYVISFKEALKQGESVPNEYLIPSHYVNAMRELYNFERKYNEVILIADRILQNEKFLDSRIIYEIRYWLCLSLARTRNRRILEEVQKIDGPDHNFLIGFYYRIIGRHEDAINKFYKVLEDNPNFYRAKRELVQVFINTEQYKEAFSLAKDNYFADKNNVYNMQSYFRCLIKLEGSKSKEELNNLLSLLENNPHIRAREMYFTAKVDYCSFVDLNNEMALEIANDAISSFPKSIYPYLSKLELLRRTKNYSELEKLIKELESRFNSDSDSDIYLKLPYLSAKFMLYISKNENDSALKLLNDKIKIYYSQTIFENLLLELNNNLK